HELRHARAALAALLGLRVGAFFDGVRRLRHVLAAQEEQVDVAGRLSLATTGAAKMKRIALALLALCFPVWAFAVTLPWQAADLPPGEIMSDPEALGLGGVRSLRGTGVRGAFGNPAGLVELAGNAVVFDGSEGPAESWPSFFPELTIHFEGGHGIPQNIAFGHSFGRTALGAAFMRTYQANFEARDTAFAENLSYRMEAYQIAAGW